MSTRFRGLVSRGVVAGVIGATALAFWFLVIDGSQGEPFRTPGFLGGALLGPDALEPGFGPVILYSLLHYAAFIGVGVGASWILSKTHTTPNIFLAGPRLRALRSGLLQKPRGDRGRRRRRVRLAPSPGG